MTICPCQKQCTFKVGVIQSHLDSKTTPNRHTRKGERSKIWWHNRHARKQSRAVDSQIDE